MKLFPHLENDNEAQHAHSDLDVLPHHHHARAHQLQGHVNENDNVNNKLGISPAEEMCLLAVMSPHSEAIVDERRNQQQTRDCGNELLRLLEEQLSRLLGLEQHVLIACHCV